MQRKPVQNERMDDAAFFEGLSASMNPKKKQTPAIDLKNIVEGLKQTQEKHLSGIHKRVSSIAKTSESNLGKELARISERLVQFEGVGNKHSMSIEELYEKFGGLSEKVGVPKDIYEFGAMIQILAGGKYVGTASQIDFEGAIVTTNGQGIVVTFSGSGAIIKAMNSGDGQHYTLTKAPTTTQFYVLMNNEQYTTDDTTYPFTASGTSLTFTNGALPPDLANTVIKLICI